MNANDVIAYVSILSAKEAKEVNFIPTITLHAVKSTSDWTTNTTLPVFFQRGLTSALTVAEEHKWT